ncbi:hypothetical protein AB0C07_18005 [Actinoplanes missouriensis]|uniref:hypothetical protein n=1 Tax=Actinoplanes missouriensis TaxID=1866 RepID=UPI0033F8BFF8
MDLITAARHLIASRDGVDHRAEADAMRQYIETVTFTPADEILIVLREIATGDWMAMPPWARNLAYRLACLQRPADVSVLREAAGDLLSFGPDWDNHAHELHRQADEIEAAG